MHKHFYNVLSFLVFTCVSLFLPQHSFASGLGPWADEVISTNQGLTKLGNPISPARSDPSKALGPAEETEAEGTFYSLGFGGSIVLWFQNAIGPEILVVESTEDPYPFETATVEVSTDGITWVLAGSVTQSGVVSIQNPQETLCAHYIRITDTSDPDDYPDEDASDGFDLDGVSASSGSCENQSRAAQSSLSTATAPVCSHAVPDAPQLLSVTRQTATSVALSWTASPNTTHYGISYGREAGNYEYGLVDVGDVTTFVVHDLDPHVPYFFSVFAYNHCSPSTRSNEVSIGKSLFGSQTTRMAQTGFFGRLRQKILQIVQPKRDSAPEKSVDNEVPELGTLQESQNTPKVVHIPEIDAILHINPATVEGNEWDMYDDAVSWLKNSDVPPKGNVVLYGHNTKELLGNLHKLAIGSEIVVGTDTEHYTYIVEKTLIVDPEDLEILSSAQDRLVIFTCVGFADSKRLVVVAVPAV